MIREPFDSASDVVEFKQQELCVFLELFVTFLSQRLQTREGIIFIIRMSEYH